MSQAVSELPVAEKPASYPDVLTLPEAADYLRVSEAEVLEAVGNHSLPGRKMGSEWRFLKTALQDWLRTADRGDVWLRQIGALQGDPYLDQILQGIEEERARAAAESE